jgi:peptidyl-prolyl cis-trans isomerase C
MELRVNGVRVEPAAGPSPEAAAARELLRQRAVQLGLLAENADETETDLMLERLLEREAPGHRPSDQECRRYYDAHPDEFTSGERVFARHILFQVTQRVPVPALRARAECALADVIRDPSRFETVARECSNCPSAERGGALGGLSRGAIVPELEAALFNGTYLGLHRQLVRSRFGFHILAVDRREPGRLVPFDAVQGQIVARLEEHTRRVALARYVSRLAEEARIEGVDWPALATLEGA